MNRPRHLFFEFAVVLALLVGVAACGLAYSSSYHSTSAHARGNFVVPQGTLNLAFANYPSSISTNSTSVNIGIASMNNSIPLLSQTRIVSEDPPQVLPTHNFTVQGILRTSSDAPLPNAPIRLNSFNVTYEVQTNAGGVFSKNFTVPANATEGIHFIYASFAPQGVFGPSINFTSIDVIRQPLDLTLKKVGLSFSGFNTTVSGSVSANGSALPGTDILVSSPWGNFQTKSNNLGEFSVSLEIPPSEFAFKRSIQVFALPAQPYVRSGAVSESLGVLNILYMVIPAIIIGSITYEVKSLGLLSRKSSTEEEIRHKMVDETIQRLMSPKSHHLPEIVSIFRESLLLASERFSLSFRESLTIREIIQQVSGIDIPREEMGFFSQIALTTENYLYSEKFDSSKVEEATLALRKLKELWRK